MQCIKEYPNEPFVVSNSKLFCNGCREELCIKKSSVKNHMASAKHKKGIAILLYITKNNMCALNN